MAFMIIKPYIDGFIKKSPSLYKYMIAEVNRLINEKDFYGSS